MAAKRASNAHHHLADAHAKKADYWEQHVALLHPFANITHPDQIRHMDAMDLHRNEAKSFASQHRDIVEGKNTVCEHPPPDENLLITKRKFELSHDHASAGLMHLEASNAYEESHRVASLAGCSLMSERIFHEMRQHGLRSFNHTPDTSRCDSKASISDGIDGRNRANEISRHYKKKEREERKR